MKSYRPEELFDAHGVSVADLAALAPGGVRRMGANPHANGGQLLPRLQLPDFRTLRRRRCRARAVDADDTRVLGRFLRDVVA